MTRRLLADSSTYYRKDATRGDTVILWCNSTVLSAVQWTQNTTDRYSDVYVNGTIVGPSYATDRFSVVSFSSGDYNLKIYNVHSVDSGLYDCYESSGRRIVGYYLVTKGMLIIIMKAK